MNMNHHHHHHHHHQLHLHLRLTSIQAPNHDSLLIELASYLNSYFSSLSSRSFANKNLKVTFEFPLCERNSFILHHHKLDIIKNEKGNDDNDDEKGNDDNREDESSAVLSPMMICQVDPRGQIEKCSCGSPYLSWMHRAKLLEDGDAIQFGWICGLPLALAQDGHTDGIYSSKMYDLVNDRENEMSNIGGDGLLQNFSISCCGGGGRTVSVSPRNHDASRQNSKNLMMPFSIYSSETPHLISNGNRKWMPIAAPRMSGSRYQTVPFPCYFSDVIVRKDADHLNSFDDLIGKKANIRWCYNEPHSQSGFNVTRDFLWRRKMMKMTEDQKNEGNRNRENEDDDAGSVESKCSQQIRLNEDFDFARVSQVGSHQESINKVISGEVDAAAVDSTVLETEVILATNSRGHDLLKTDIKIIHVLGPSMSPPIVVNRLGLESAIRRQVLSHHLEDDHDTAVKQIADRIVQLITEALTFTDEEEEDNGQKNEKKSHLFLASLLEKRRKIFEKYNVASFDQVQDKDYDVIRQMLKNSLKFPAW